MLARPDVLAQTLRAFAQAAGSLAEQLLAALEAGEAAGCDKRGRQSAALKIASRDPVPASRERFDPPF
jgi:uncharacterized Ntn-hydrolase superfamily protein